MRFEATFSDRNMSFSLGGTVGGDILNAPPLDTTVLRNFTTSSEEINNARVSFNLANLLRVKNIFLAYMASSFPAYKLEQCTICWRNGEDVIVLP